ncbi:HAMP domain-containing histidine kinase [Tissierella sp. MSJ-40]|uniref:histidine kinase n=1 Tax=Tissierella simiarum TaxID=2841534 RepID=A0ABS6E823_9FIRM|nr:HAMP domain-containing sensor histidine kinase [Tissierella simiarum]MBU5439001.1 HAMP domain-containing histidine kinase [Tissierella simiarum]
MKLSKKLTMSFIFSIILSIFIISLISNSMINRKFESFLVKERENRFEQIRKDINDLYLKNSYTLSQRDIANYASLEGVYIEIKDSNNQTQCHSSKGQNMGMHRKMMNNGHMRMMQNISAGNYLERSFPLLDGKNIVGTLIIGYIDNSYLTESALIFKNTLTKSFMVSGIITIILGFGISILLSKGLTNPLVNIRNTAIEMRKGNLEYRSKVNTSTTEILELSDSINFLGETLASQANIRKRYATDIAHELRTPLTTLKSHLEAIIDGVWEPSEKHFSILMEEVERLSDLVEDLKNSFNAEEVKINTKKTQFNISAELEKIIIAFIPLYNEKNFSIDYSLEENIEIFMDKDKFRQIIYNLLSNSIKYLKENGIVFISLKKHEEKVVIKIKDNGIGIKKEDLPFIFERFYRSDISRNKETGGTGLGLSIVKSLVEAHNGIVEVQSEYNKGTEFTIVLPIEY